MSEPINLEQDQDEFVQYTADQAYSNLNKIQEHLEIILTGNKILFCTACLYKHLDHISTRECIGASCPSLEVWIKLADWGTKNKKKILKLLRENEFLTHDEALKMAEEARYFRKEMEKIMVGTKTSKGHLT